jgi:hypothetical protein
VKAAIDLIIFEALPMDEAAEKAGITPHGLYKAFKKQPVMGYYKAQLEVLRTSAGPAGVAKIAQLMHQAGSEHVQLAAAQWTAGIFGIVPAVRSENLHLHAHSHLVPGITIVRMPPQLLDIEALPMGQVIDVPVKRSINRIGTPALHPSQIKGGQ